MVAFKSSEPPKSVLDPVRHRRLLDDIEHICAVAHVPQKFVAESMTSYCDSTEVDYVVNFRLYRTLHPGLLIHGKPNAEERSMAICGAFIRNFIDARVVTLSKLLEYAESGNVPDPTVMVIPNLYVASYGKTLPAWKVASVYDILISRWTANKPTIAVVESLPGLQQAYGLAFAQHLQHYVGA